MTRRRSSCGLWRALQCAAIMLLICLAAASRADAGACLWKREQPSGSYKICWYGCAGGDVAVSIKATRPCPLKIEH
jgi:hypothetical protein